GARPVSRPSDRAISARAVSPRAIATMPRSGPAMQSMLSNPVRSAPMAVELICGAGAVARRRSLGWSHGARSVALAPAAGAPGGAAAAIEEDTAGGGSGGSVDAEGGGVAAWGAWVFASSPGLTFHDYSAQPALHPGCSHPTSCPLAIGRGRARLGGRRRGA